MWVLVFVPVISIGAIIGGVLGIIVMFYMFTILEEVDPCKFALVGAGLYAVCEIISISSFIYGNKERTKTLPQFSNVCATDIVRAIIATAASYWGFYKSIITFQEYDDGVIRFFIGQFGFYLEIVICIALMVANVVAGCTMKNSCYSEEGELDSKKLTNLPVIGICISIFIFAWTNLFI